MYPDISTTKLLLKSEQTPSVKSGGPHALPGLPRPCGPRVRPSYKHPRPWPSPRLTCCYLRDVLPLVPKVHPGTSWGETH